MLAHPDQVSVVGETVEINQAVAWGRAHPAWRDDDPPIVSSESILGPGRRRV